MPDRLAITEIPDRLAALDDVGDDVDFRKFLDERLAIGIGSRRVELAEMSAECEELRIRELLPAGYDHKPRPPRLRDRIRVAARQRLR